MKQAMYIELLIDYKDGLPRKEPVHARELGENEYLLDSSPGFVIGVASGDTIKILNQDGKFEVLERGFNLAVQLYSTQSIRARHKELSDLLVPLKGYIDGAIEKGIVCTIPLSAGFSEIEKVFNSFVNKYPEIEWYYGNVYDPDDGITPLNWWNKK